MATRFGAVAANILSLGARIAGFLIYYGLRITYRPNERLIAIGVVAGLVAVAVLLWVALHA